jgi:hypothetical protein
MGGVVINAKPLVVNISPLGFNRYANDFLKAAQYLKGEDRFSPVPYYLYCRSIELSLKSFLLVKGVPNITLKNRNTLGHNLEKNLKKAESLGLSDVIVITTQHRMELKKANEYYASKGFEYFKVVKALKGYKDLPDLSVLSNLASLLVSKLEPVCLSAA